MVDDDSKLMSLFEAMVKSLNVYLHWVSKRNHKAVGVERYQDHQCGTTDTYMFCRSRYDFGVYMECHAN